MKQKLCDDLGSTCFGEVDLEILRCGEGTFLWESPLAASAEEAVDLARQAALEMTPVPERVILAAAVLPSLLRTMRRREEQPLSETEQKQMAEWLQNGGKPSILQFHQLSGEEMETVCGYLPELSAYEEVTVDGRQFVLVHAGREHFSSTRPLEEYDLEDFLFCRPDPDAAYFPDKTLVFGHTPTRRLYKQIGEAERLARIFHRGTMIGIDCGCAHPGGRLGCLCLDTMEEFYV